MISQSKESYEPKELIDHIKAIRDSDKNIKVCLENFLKYSALLVKSPISLLLHQKRDKEWNLLSSYGFDNSIDEKKEAIELALQMSSRVIKNGFAYEGISIEWLDFENEISFAVKIDNSFEKSASFIFFIIEYQTQKYLSEMIIRTLMNSDIPDTLFRREKRTEEYVASPTVPNGTTDSLGIDVLEILSKIIFQEKFILASMFLVNEIAIRFNCSKVSLGWEKGSYINPIAISHIEKFDKNMESIRALEALYEESADQNKEILYPLKELGDSIVFAHHHYIDTYKAKEVLSIPFRVGSRVVGVMSCEKGEGSFSEKELILIRLVSNYLTPWLDELHFKDSWIGSRIVLKARKSLSNFFTLKHTFLKFLIVAVLAFIIYSSFGKWSYKIEVVSSLETDNIAFISAPFNGLVYSVNVHAGDKVKKGDKLLSLDKDELYLKESKALVDINKYESESEKARAKNSLADMSIALLNKKEAELNLESVNYYLKKSDIFSPLKGVIIAGNKEELLGAPIAKGDLLFKVVQSVNLYLKLKIPESSIDEINSSLGGEFALLSSPNKRYHFKIENIIPMAEVDKSGGNIFIAQAKVIDSPENWWRAGMSGVAKIEVGQRNILWILTHNFIEFIHIYFWI